MEEIDYRVARFDRLILFLPHNMREKARRISKEKRASAEEIRLRAGQKPTMLSASGEMEFSEDTVSRKDLQNLMEIATGASAYASRETLRFGYITVNGGYRIGVCGTPITENGNITGFRSISSVNMRISREIKDAGREIVKNVFRGKAESMLIISPPGFGKTTVLRDVIRRLSDGVETDNCYRIAVADERGEIASLVDGAPQMDIGTHTDVIDSCPKAVSILMLLRAMNPQIIAADEITAPEDIEAIEKASNCGVKIIATAHAKDVYDLVSRPLYKRIMERRIFKTAVVIEKDGDRRNYRLYDLEAIR